MKVDKRQYSKSESRIDSINIRGPLFIGGYSEKYSPSYLSVRTNSFLHGNLRNLKINEKRIDCLTIHHTAAIREFYHLTSKIMPINTDRSFLNSPKLTRFTSEKTLLLSNE